VILILLEGLPISNQILERQEISSCVRRKAAGDIRDEPGKLYVLKLNNYKIYFLSRLQRKFGF